MDREILFRGKRLDNGEWVEGSYMEHYYSSRFGCVSAIFTNDDVLCKTYRIPVDPSAVGQYTGLTDKNGKKIFEGDIVKWGHVPGYRENPVRIAEVKLAPDIQFETIIGERQHVFHYGAFLYAERADKALEVIGNIHDNPELIGGEDDG